MATLPTLYCIHGADAPQHLGRIQQISQKFKKDQRIADFMLLPSEKAADILPGQFREDDLIILLLTYELESKRRDITTLLSQIRKKIPEGKIAEIIIDNIPFVNDYITLPMDLKPIRNAEQMDIAWLDIEENLRQMLPTAPVGWRKYLKYVVAVSLALVALLIWKPWRNQTLSSDPAPIEIVDEAQTATETTPTNNTSNDPSSDFPNGSTQVYSADFSQWNVAHTEHGVVSLGFGNSYVLQPSTNTWIGSATQPVVPALTGDFVFDVRFRIEEPNPSSALSLTLTGDGNDAESVNVYFDFWGPGNVDYTLYKGRVKSGGDLAVPHAINEEIIAERVKAPAPVLNHNWAQGGKLTLKREGLVMQFFINDVFVKDFRISTFQVVKTSIGVAFASKVTFTSIEGRLKN